MDAIDETIIAELTRNARMSHAEIAQKVLLSRTAVRQRIERLEREGHIAGYTIVRSPESAHDRVSAFVLVYRQDRMRDTDVLSALCLIPEVSTCEVLTGGDFDIIVRLESTSLQRIQEIWDQIARMSGVRDTVTTLTLATLVYRPRS